MKLNGNPLTVLTTETLPSKVFALEKLLTQRLLNAWTHVSEVKEVNDCVKILIYSYPDN